MSITPEVLRTALWRAAAPLRLNLHSHPELSFEETRTTQKILETLQTLPGVEVLAVGAKTGAVARLAGGSGPAVALRADIDAIPQHEVVQRPDASVYEGKMHACGHDIHTTALLGAAMALCEEKKRPARRCIFRVPARGGGAFRRKNTWWSSAACSMLSAPRPCSACTITPNCRWVPWG